MVELAIDEEAPWLKNWCVKTWHDTLIKRDKIFAEPCAGVMWHGQPYTVATNGSAVFFLNGVHTTMYDNGKHSDVLRRVLEAAHWPKTPPRPINLDALRVHVGQTTDPSLPCKGCDGSGTYECWVCVGTGVTQTDLHGDLGLSCLECDGAGTLPCRECQPDRPRRLSRDVITIMGGPPLDSRLVRTALRFLPVLPGAMWSCDEFEPQPAIGVIETKAWTLGIMPLDQSTRDKVTPRVFTGDF